ncbi:BA14K family protein [Roseibium algae]|uniref:Lectin-like protein BA14k n=1 Tax=Roseibium algae TaxID=3123038 RepID=A0ABU8TPK9_9HYPH
MSSISKLIAVIAVMTMSAISIAPTSAMPLTAKSAQFHSTIDGALVQVKSRKGYYTRNGERYYNGHRGYNKKRKGYRQFNGWWFPSAAFSAGPDGSNVKNHGRKVQKHTRLSRKHYAWCEKKYRSYRASDNTFNPYKGPRRACRSPF